MSRRDEFPCIRGFVASNSSWIWDKQKICVRLATCNADILLSIHGYSSKKQVVMGGVLMVRGITMHEKCHNVRNRNRKWSRVGQRTRRCKQVSPLYSPRLLFFPSLPFSHRKSQVSTPLSALAPSRPGTLVLLTDGGTILVHETSRIIQFVHSVDSSNFLETITSNWLIPIAFEIRLFSILRDLSRNSERNEIS